MTKPNRILIVDDDQSARRIMSLILRKKGYEIDTATDGREALIKVGETAYNVALLDVRLPDAEGIDLIAPLRQMQPDMVSFVVTGHASLETAVEAVNQGAAGYITKPVDMERMIASIEDALEKQRLIMENRRLLEQVQAELQDRKRAEEAMRQSEARYRVLVENAPVGILSATITGDILNVNSKILEILGSPSAEATQTFNLLTFPNFVEAGISADFQTCLDTGELVVNEKRYDSHWGKQIVLRYHFSPIRETAEEISGVQAIVEDVTERRQAEAERLALMQQIRQQAGQMQETINAVPDGVFVLGAENRVLLVNPVAERQLQVLAGVSQGEAVDLLGNRPIGELLIPPQKRHWHEIEIESPEHLVFEVAARPLELDAEGTPGWVLVVRDMTRQREIQLRTQQQQHLATVGQLAAGIAHDFNNLLAVIVLYTQLALHTPDLPFKLRERLNTISDQAQRASDLIQQILDFSRRAVLERHPLNLRPFLKEQVRLLQRTLPENVRIQMNYGDGDFMINADPTRIQQALLNLGINARDAMPHGGDLRLTLDRIQLKPDQEPFLPEMEPGEWVMMAVADSGTGIQPEALPHIFEPFFTTKEVGKGSGLGLAQVYGIVKQHEGHVDVKTQLGEGTQFIFYLPALPASAKMESSRFVDQVMAGGGELILVVEDDPVLRTAVASSLESLNYRVVSAANGRDAVALFDEYYDEISLVLSDIVMPEVGGKDLLKILKRKRPSLRAIVMTGHLLTEELKELKAQGMVEWLQKPLRLEQLADTVARTLAM